jgi:hypothetical protein
MLFKTSLRGYFLKGLDANRVARWFVFKPKIPILVKYGGPWNIKCCYFLCPFGIFMAIRYNLQPFGLFLWSFGIVFSRVGMFEPRKSGNPGRQQS